MFILEGLLGLALDSSHLEKHSVQCKTLLKCLLFKEIKAAHLAIEAPFQVLLKLSMISIGILPMPGKTYNSVSLLNTSWATCPSSGPPTSPSALLLI